MIRGTTPTLQFTISSNITMSDIQEMWLTFAQFGKVIISKTMKDMSIDNGVVTVTLTQDETLKLKSGRQTNMQLRLLLNDGTALASGVKRFSIGDVLQEGEISGN